MGGDAVVRLTWGGRATRTTCRTVNDGKVAAGGGRQRFDAQGLAWNAQEVDQVAMAGG